MAARHIVFALFVALAPLGGCGSTFAPAGKEMSWCQVDDPGQVEFERRKRKLPADKIGDIPCAPLDKKQPVPDELVLPMPCGRHMVFRAVKVAVGDALDSERAQFGNADIGEPFRKAIAGPWWGEIAGNFPTNADGSGQSTYYIGKYEVTAPQYAIFSGADPAESYADGSPACKRAAEALAKLDGAHVLPAVNLSWNEAIEWSDRYSRWLIAQEKAGGGLGSIMPANESRPGFVRLPTEAEWEFAARDGRETGSNGQTYEIADGWGVSGAASLQDIAWYNGIGVTPPDGSKVYYVGMKKPNRLQLFDMLGNAEELTQELFRPVRPDGSLAGRTGGFVARGGGAADNEEAVGVGARREIEAYDANGPARTPTLGFRLVLSAPYFVNARGKNGEMQGNAPLRDGVAAAWTRRAGGEGDAGAVERSTAAAVLSRMAADANGSGSALPSDFAALRGQLALASAKVAERERQATEDQVLAALLAAGYARERQGKIEMIDKTLADFSANGAGLRMEDRQLAARIAMSRPDNIRERDASYAYYIQTIVQLAHRPPDQARQAIIVTADRLRRAGLTRLLSMMAALGRQVEEARKGVPDDATRARWVGEVSRV